MYRRCWRDAGLTILLSAVLLVGCSAGNSNGEDAVAEDTVTTADGSECQPDCEGKPCGDRLPGDGNYEGYFEEYPSD